MSAVPERPFVDSWRRRKSAGFDLSANSTARRTIDAELWGSRVEVYANANLSIYSGQKCNARCPFCVEELRPAARGVDLARQKRIEADDGLYFSTLEETLTVLRPLDLTVSVTGGEPSKDPRLPRILRTLAAQGWRKRTLTTNGSGLLDRRDGRPLLEWILESGLRHLNISRAHPDPSLNARLMALPEPFPLARLGEIVRRCRAEGVRPRLSCVLLREGIGDFQGLLAYIDFARSLGADNVIFRQLMKTDPGVHAGNFVVRYSDRQRVPLEPLLDRVSADPRFGFQKQIVGYYYYVEVWRFGEVDVVFEEADLGQLERVKRSAPGVVHELVFHPDGTLASTWQPWDGVLRASSSSSPALAGAAV